MKTTPLPLKHSMNRTPYQLGLLLSSLVLACFALSPQAQAACQQGCLTNENTVLGDDALLGVTTAADDTAMGLDPMYRNTTGSDDALASWIWRGTRRLHKAHYSHTATLLQNGQVLVAGGIDSTGHISASAELYDPASETWSAAGRLNTGRFTHTATLLQNGMVLVAGGQESSSNGSASAELYDPTSRTWSATG